MIKKVINHQEEFVAQSSSGGGSLDQQQADWNQSNSSAVDFIKNKPNIPIIINDAGYDYFGLTDSHTELTVRKLWETLNTKGYAGKEVIINVTDDLTDAFLIKGSNFADGQITCHVTSNEAWAFFKGSAIDGSGTGLYFNIYNTATIGEDAGVWNVVMNDEDAMYKADINTIAPDFSTQTSYAVGGYVNYNGFIWRCTTAHTGAWDEGDFTKVTITGELSGKADKASLGTAAAKDSTNAVTENSTALVESGAVKTAIDTAIASAYHHAGTKTVSELVAALLVAANVGNVYNITDSGTTTADFIEGAGKIIRAGDNVGIAKVDTDTYKFDLLSGFVDVSAKADKVTSATSGNFAGLDASGNLTDSGKKAADFATDDEISSLANVYGSKNLLAQNAWIDASSGLTVTRNSDGSITISGTSTGAYGYSQFTFTQQLTLKAGTYILTGNTINDGNCYLRVGNDDLSKRALDFGSGATLTLTADTILHAEIIIPNAAGAINTTFYPMLRDARIIDPTYVPYAKTNRELTVTDPNLAPTENGATASTGYLVGSYFVRFGQLCRCKQAITTGTQFTKDTNYEETNVATEVSKTRQYLRGSSFLGIITDDSSPGRVVFITSTSGAGVMFESVFGGTTLHFDSGSGGYTLQIGFAHPSATLPTVITQGTDRYSFVNHTVTAGHNVVPLPAYGLYGLMFIGFAYDDSPSGAYIQNIYIED